MFAIIILYKTIRWLVKYLLDNFKKNWKLLHFSGRLSESLFFLFQTYIPQDHALNINTHNLAWSPHKLCMRGHTNHRTKFSHSSIFRRHVHYKREENLLACDRTPAIESTRRTQESHLSLPLAIIKTPSHFFQSKGALESHRSLFPASGSASQQSC